MLSFAPLFLIPLLAARALPAQGPLAVVAMHPGDGPTVLIHRQASPLVALRMSAPVPAELPEGSVELLQELVRPQVEAAAAAIGASLELRYEDGHAIALVAGPAAAFDALAGLLRRLTGEPDLAAPSLLRARARAEARVLARLEQPGPRLRASLHNALFGRAPPTGADATLLGPEAVRGLRAALYATDRLTVVLVGDLPPEAVRAAFSRWPRPAAVTAALRPDSAAPPARSQAHHEWAAIGYGLDADPAVVAVAAALVGARIAASPLRSGDAAVLHGPLGTALVVMGAAVPGDTVVAAVAGITDLAVRDPVEGGPLPVTRYLRRLIAEASSTAGPAAVADAATALRRRLLLEARTAAGKAEVVGRLADSYGRHDAADAVLGRLERVTLDEVRAALGDALAAPAVVMEVRP